MKLKNLLVIVFLTLTLIPIIIVSLLLYKSGFDLSKKAYTNNLTESINVQSDFISQTVRNNMLSDYHFSRLHGITASLVDDSPNEKNTQLITSFQSYLETSQDKIAACLLLDKKGNPLYTIGEKDTLNIVKSQLIHLSDMEEQKVLEFHLDGDSRTLGIITPIRTADNTYMGSLISIFDKSYIFKIISSYYEITDTFTYICNSDGDIINFRGLTDKKKSSDIENILKTTEYSQEGTISKKINSTSITGYYKNIQNTSWYLAGFVEDKLIYSFTNKFVFIYILIILAVCAADIVLSVYFSSRVVEPINNLIHIMTCYEDNLGNCNVIYPEKRSYYETRFLHQKFMALMQKILLVQHNFEGVYQLYQSSDMDDTNIDIDVVQQVISSNKNTFQELMNDVYFSETDCIVQRFTRCFCEKDQAALMDIFTRMRDEHLSVTSETDAYTPHLGEKWYHVLVVPMYQNDRLSRLFVQLRDITGFKRHEVQSMEQARRDMLTGLYNRSGFTDAVRELLAGSTTETHGLLFIDMNYFKMVNDNFGHNAGDKLLQTVGNVIIETVGCNDITSRFGGDEFALFLPDTSMEHIQQVKEKIQSRLVFTFDTGHFKFDVSASVGLSIWSRANPASLEELLGQADASMYEVKRIMKEGIS